MYTTEILIKPRSKWQPLQFRELWVNRELLGFLTWRDVKIRYKQTALGGAWAILQPLIGMAIFAVLFTRVAPIQTYGTPYPLFVYAGLVPWTFFANALALSSNSLVASEHLIRKIYFPRVFLPFASMLALVFDMIIGLAFMGILLAYYHRSIGENIVWLPLFLFGCFMVTAGLGLGLSALNVHFRDVKYVVPFFTQMAFFLTPVLYPIRSVPEKFKILLSLNPMVGMVEGVRHAILGGPISWNLVTTSMVGASLLFLAGLYLFNRMERSFADII
jgi:homopolymeric O-antigen transport system permease protein